MDNHVWVVDDVCEEVLFWLVHLYDMKTILVVVCTVLLPSVWCIKCWQVVERSSLEGRVHCTVGGVRFVQCGKKFR